MEDKDCFIFSDPTECALTIMCVDCRNKHRPDTGAFYRGSVDGYSSYDWKCDLCGEFIHKQEPDE